MIHIYLSETSKCSLHQQCGLNCLLKSLCWNPVLRTSIESDSSEPWGRWIGSNKLASLTGAPLRRGVLTKVYWQRSEHRGHSQKVAYWLTKKRAMEETQYADRLFHPRSPATRTMRKVTPVILWMSLVFFYYVLYWTNPAEDTHCWLNIVTSEVKSGLVSLVKIQFIFLLCAFLLCSFAIRTCLPCWIRALMAYCFYILIHPIRTPGILRY